MAYTPYKYDIYEREEKYGKFNLPRNPIPNFMIAYGSLYLSLFLYTKYKVGIIKKNSTAIIEHIKSLSRYNHYNTKYKYFNYRQKYFLNRYSISDYLINRTDYNDLLEKVFYNMEGSILELGSNIELNRSYINYQYISKYDIMEYSSEIIDIKEYEYSQMQMNFNQLNIHCPEFNFINYDYSNLKNYKFKTQYDNVISMHSLSYVENPKEVLNSMISIVKSGGSIYIVENGISDLKIMNVPINAFRKIWDDYNFYYYGNTQLLNVKEIVENFVSEHNNLEIQYFDQYNGNTLKMYKIKKL